MTTRCLPRTSLVATARAGATTCLAGLGLLHAAWALGSHWPAPSASALADAVVGAQAPPARVPTAVVAAGLLGSAAAVSGAVGPSRSRRPMAVALGVVFAARAAVGGSAAARSITSTAPSARFTALDRLLYRPLCAAIAAALLVSAADGDATTHPNRSASGPAPRTAGTPEPVHGVPRRRHDHRHHPRPTGVDEFPILRRVTRHALRRVRVRCPRE